MAERSQLRDTFVTQTPQIRRIVPPRRYFRMSTTRNSVHVIHLCLVTTLAGEHITQKSLVAPSTTAPRASVRRSARRMASRRNEPDRIGA